MASVLTPNRALKGFQRLRLKAGETQTVTFKIRQADVALWNASQQWAVEPGDYEAMVGKSSAETINAAFALK